LHRALSLPCGKTESKSGGQPFSVLLFYRFPDFLYPSDLPILKAYFNTPVMPGCAGQNILNNSFCEFSRPLIFLEYDPDEGSFFDIRTNCSVHDPVDLLKATTLIAILAFFSDKQTSLHKIMPEQLSEKTGFIRI
jgi:hypothetical protein